MTKSKKIILIVLSVILSVFMLSEIFSYFTYMGYKGRTQPGTAVNGKYYYSVVGKGVYEYTPGQETRKVMDCKGINYQLEATEDGLYLRQEKEILFYDFSTGEERLFFNGSRYGCEYITVTAMTNGDIRVILYDDASGARQIVLKGTTGDVVVPLSQWEGIADMVGNAVIDYYVGDRYITRNIGVKETMSFVTLEENGHNILPEDMAVYSGFPNKCGDNLIFGVYKGEYENESSLLILRPDGNDEILSIPGYPEHLIYNHQNNIYGYYAFYKDSSRIVCHNIYTGENWTLIDLNLADIWVNWIYMDENYIYGWAEGQNPQICWEIIRDDDGKPVSLELISDGFYI